MKKLTLFCLLLASAALAQDDYIYVPIAGTNYHTGSEAWPYFTAEGYYYGMPSNSWEWPAWQSWRAVNTNFHKMAQRLTGTSNAAQALSVYCTNGFAVLTAQSASTQIQVSNIQGQVAALQASPSLPNNVMLSSSKTIIYSTNYFAFGGSNYVGHFTNLFGWKMSTPSHQNGLAPATNQFEQVCISPDLTNWFAVAQGWATNGPVYVSISGVIGGYGPVTIYGCDHPELVGRVNGFFGQSFQFGEPINASDAATKSYVDSTVHVMIPPVQLAGGWLLDTALGASNETVTFSSYGSPALQLTTATGQLHVDSASLDGAGNILLSLPTNSPAGWFFEAATNLAPPVSWTVFTNYTQSVSGSEYVLNIPINYSLATMFFRARITTTPTAFVNGLLQLIPRTITNATDTTWGAGSGILCVDSNYLYVSVGTNRWKRSALSSW